MKTSLLLLCGTLAFSNMTMSAQETTKLTAAKHNEYGLIYSLPITHFDVEIDATKTVRKAGPFAKYAKKYLSVDDAILNDAQEWTITGVSVNPYGIPDKNEEYLMQFKSGSSPFLILNSRGLPLAINVEEKETPLVVREPKPATTSILDNNAYASALPGELLASESLAKRAEMAATMIYKIRESRTNIITGEADQLPPDGTSMKLTMDQLNSQEAALMALFVGTTTTENVIKHFDYLPGTEVKNEVLLRVSDFFGIVDKSDLSGEPVYLTLRITEQGELPVNEKGEEKKLPKGAVMYKIPGSAQLTLTFEGKTLYDKNIQVSQYGVDFGLEPSMFTDKKNPSYVIFNPETGSIKEIGNVSAKQ